MDQFNAMKAFCRVLETGSFTAAAAEINAAHTVMSKLVRQLENELGVQLFNRSTRKLAVTEAGQVYYQHARRIIDAVEEANLALSQHHTQVRGTLRINAPMAFGVLDVAWWLPEFMQAYPDVNIDLVCNDRVVDLIEEGFDLALRLSRELPDSSLMARRLGQSPSMLVATPEYLQQHGTPQTPQDLLAHNCLTYSILHKPREWQFVRPDGELEVVHIRGSMQANTGIALRAAALAGIGIAVSAGFIVHEDLREGRLISVLDDYRMPARDLFAMYPHNRHLSPKVRAFIDFASAHYSRHQWT